LSLVRRLRRRANASAPIFPPSSFPLRRRLRREHRHADHTASADHPPTKYAKEPIAGPFGFPLRLRISTKLGFKNPNWIVAIEVTNTFPETLYSTQGFNWFSGI
jgi:DMSO/TMAO reductase YedYZ molybdopterin-dependent catalytic subunit